MSGKYCYIDFEFNGVSEPKLNLVSCALQTGDTYTFWLHKDHIQQYDLTHYLEELNEEGYIFICYAVTAEARSFLALNLKPTNFKWIDLFLEHRCLTNHNHRMQYGKQLVKGKVVNTFPPKPKWEKVEGEKGSQKAEQGLANACYKFLGVEIDSDRKNRVRDLIISTPKEFTEEEQQEILEYNESDIQYLPRLFQAMIKEYKRLLPEKNIKTLKEEMLWRGEYAARTAMMEQVGYPIDYKATLGFAKSVPLILKDIQRDINSQFPETMPFQWSKIKQKFTWKQEVTRDYIKYNYPQFVDRWLLTDKKKLSLSLEGFSRHFGFNHSYPRNNFGAQIVRFLKTKQHLNGFLPGGKGKSFWDYVGSDGRVRPYFNIYRAQSSRSQPAATGFLFLKAAWLRALCVPPQGKAIGAIDWASQEFLIAALLSDDKAMIEAYESGDVYLWFGKACKKIPEDATKKSHTPLRDRFKSSVLGIQYQMGYEALANKIANDTGEPCSEEDAQDFIDMFDDIFHVYAAYRDEIVDDYEIKGYLQLADGWYMFGDNPNFRSVGNCPIQGMGAAIMRKAVQLAQDVELNVIQTLHDALYIEEDSDCIGVNMEVLAECMDEAFRFYFPKRLKKRATCRLEGNIWSQDFPVEDSEIIIGKDLVTKKQKVYIDSRSISEYKKFQKYFDASEEMEML